MSITLEVPETVERRLREIPLDLEQEAREALALNLFRHERITHWELCQLLGLDRRDTDAFLVDHGEFAQSPDLDELEQDYRDLTAFLIAQNK